MAAPPPTQRPVALPSSHSAGCETETRRRHVTTITRASPFIYQKAREQHDQCNALPEATGVWGPRPCLPGGLERTTPDSACHTGWYHHHPSRAQISWDRPGSPDSAAEERCAGRACVLPTRCTTKVLPSTMTTRSGHHRPRKASPSRGGDVMMGVDDHCCVGSPQCNSNDEGFPPQFMASSLPSGATPHMSSRSSLPVEHTHISCTFQHTGGTRLEEILGGNSRRAVKVSRDKPCLPPSPV